MRKWAGTMVSNKDLVRFTEGKGKGVGGEDQGKQVDESVPSKEPIYTDTFEQIEMNKFVFAFRVVTLMEFVCCCTPLR